MDINPGRENAKTVLLLHGKNFNGFYWKRVIESLTREGYRVIVPDQVGWGKSDRPDIHYSFHNLAANTKQLLDSLGIRKVMVVGHSMGGMLATRFALLYPQLVEKLVLENPIGLEDYKTFVPYQSIDTLRQTELKATYESYLAYQKTYYPVWKAEYETLVKIQAQDLTRPDFEQVALVNALTYQMIYEQPVCYEFKNIRMPLLLIIGQADRTVVGKNKMQPMAAATRGQYPELGRAVAKSVKTSTLVELPGVGHIPHIQSFDLFIKPLLAFLK